jgi:uncharacterized 2Fe-2S/4Fe-4S cluster protein (DUF4445 family)
MSVKLTINSKDIEAEAGPSLFDYAEQLDIQVPTSCLKQGKCRECLVEVVEGMDCLSEPSEEEEHLQDNFRLSCRCRVTSDTGTVRCHTMRRASMRIQEHCEALPTLEKLKTLDPAVTRNGDRIQLDGEEIARSTEPIYGLAMDLGTTTVVLRLINLETGKLEATTSFENPQRFGGSDVMARIKYDTDHKDRLLQRTLIGYLGRAIESLPVDPNNIYELVVAANSTMRDIFFGLSVASIGQKPYWSLTQQEMMEGKRDTTSLSYTGKKMRLPIHPQARVHGLPLISGHVGADATACLLAIDLAHEERFVALMDIGTNTELVVGTKDKILAASCPAGPAFEGGAISCGMPGLDGAVEKVVINEDGSVDTTVIGNEGPEGICGSGMIDVLSELLRTGHMNQLGRFENGSGYFKFDEERDIYKFMINEEHNIYFMENDASELAQAKGANVAGLHIVLKNYDKTFDDLDIFYLAGGFARHLDVEAARRVGLIPNLPDEKIVQIGNAAIEGATIALMSKSKRDELETLIRTIKHVELETDPNFFEYFVIGCQYVPVESGVDSTFLT